MVNHQWLVLFFLLYPELFLLSICSIFKIVASQKHIILQKFVPKMWAADCDCILLGKFMGEEKIFHFNSLLSKHISLCLCNFIKKLERHL